MAVLTPATANDMPANWSFPWPELCQAASREGQNIIKLVVEEQVWGLVQYGVYPKPKAPVFVEIDHLETNPVSRSSIANRLIEPVGKWLLWYCVNVGLQHCSGDSQLVFLFSRAKAFGYYRNKVQMEYIDSVDLGAGEKVHAFKFSRTSAKAYSQQQEERWGVPSAFDLGAS